MTNVLLAECPRGFFPRAFHKILCFAFATEGHGLRKLFRWMSYSSDR